MTAKAFLGRAYRLDLKINTKLEQLVSLRSLAFKVTSTIRLDKTSGNWPRRSTMEESVVKIMMAEQTINMDIDQYIVTKAETAATIGLVAGEEQRLLLELRYLCFNTWEQIAVKMGYSCSYVYKLHSSALDAIDLILQAERESA